MFAKLPIVLSAALFAALSVSAVDSADAAAPVCQDSMFFGNADPGGADLCDPSTDPALVAGVKDCRFQGQDGFWCCDGADCTCFCDEADADAYCGGFLGQATCQGNAATCDDFFFYGAVDPGGADLCDPSTDAALQAGAAQCDDQGGFWCCDGADCTCFCDEADANDYCGGYLGQSTCQGSGATCEDFVFFGAADPGGADLCDPSTDAALQAGAAQCDDQGGFWCCDGADCTCFCDEADANAYCGGFLGQATCQGGGATCSDFVFFGAVDPGGADLCDPSTDPALQAGAAQCDDQGGFWCCDGADCTCFCDEADANAYCGGFLGQATC